MVREIRLHVEGGGKGTAERAVRQGLSQFFKREIGTQAGFQIIVGGARAETFKGFRNSLRDFPNAMNLLLHECDVHTLLRLPTGVFYAQGVKANVLFFDRKPGREAPWTQTLWIYDLRTNKNFTLKTSPLQRSDLDEFVACYNPSNRHERSAKWSEANPDGRWRAYSYDELIQRDKVSLDVFWLRDESLEESANLPDPELLAAEIAEDLQAALEQFAQIAEDLGTAQQPVVPS